MHAGKASVVAYPGSVGSWGELPVMHRMADGRPGHLHTLGHRGCGLGGGSIRAPTWRLSATAWRTTGEPYLVLEVPAADLPRLAAGFETVLDGLVPQMANPHARIEFDAGMVTLRLRGQVYGPVAPQAPWPGDGLCQLFAVAAGILPTSGAGRETTVVDLINSGQALMAVNPICPPQ